MRAIRAQRTAKTEQAGYPEREATDGSLRRMKRPGSARCSEIERYDRFWYSGLMNRDEAISHDRREETPEAKTRWFRSLSIEDRMRVLCELTDLALSINPLLPERKLAQPIPGRIQVISAA